MRSLISEPLINGRRHAVVVGLGFGDEGKGTIVDYLAHEAVQQRRGCHVVRFNGGGQAGHNVYASDGRHHTFSQFGAGFFQGTQTHLSRFMLVDPLALISEARYLEGMSVGSAMARLSIEREALLVTPFHSAANKAKEEARGVERHGSCGMGIGETTWFSLQYPAEAPRVKDVQDIKTLRRKLWALHDIYQGIVPTASMPNIDDLISVYRAFNNAIRMVDERYLSFILEHQPVIFEGAQGVLLDQDYGTHPYTTWSKTTPENALELLRDAGMEDDAEVIGVTRTYATRHGAGPFPTEDAEMTAELPDPHNVKGNWQGSFRVGHLDLPLMRYAIDVSKRIDSLAVTHLDTTWDNPQFADDYQDGVPVTFILQPDRDAQIELTESLSKAKPILSPMDDPLSIIEGATGLTASIVSSGRKASDKQIRIGVDVAIPV